MGGGGDGEEGEGGDGEGGGGGGLEGIFIVHLYSGDSCLMCTSCLVWNSIC